jgi:hypothetical protein
MTWPPAVAAAASGQVVNFLSGLKSLVKGFASRGILLEGDGTALRVRGEDSFASMPPFSRQNIATGMNESNVLTCQRSHEIRRSIKRKK